MVWFLALVSLSAPAYAQQKKAPQKWPVESLTVEGLKNYSQQQALAVTGLKVGQLAGMQDFEAARDRFSQPVSSKRPDTGSRPQSGRTGMPLRFRWSKWSPSIRCASKD
jgi:hypothetical protein